MVVTIYSRDTINCKVTIVLCNGALEVTIMAEIRSLQLVFEMRDLVLSGKYAKRGIILFL